MTGNSETMMFEVPGSRLRELGEAERQRDRLYLALTRLDAHINEALDEINAARNAMPALD